MVELAHEALARAWPRLRDWLDDDVEGQRLLRHLSGVAGTWDGAGRPDSELYRGVRLTRALYWRNHAHPGLNPTEEAFLDAGQNFAEGERRAAEDRARHTRAYATIEGQLELSCRHDSHDLFECMLWLRQPRPPEWSMEAVLALGAGAHLDRLANELEAFFA